MKIIIKKEINEQWISYKGFRTIPRILYKIIKKYYELRGYEVEELEE